jgi:polysaccharide export outer membrane protein
MLRLASGWRFSFASSSHQMRARKGSNGSKFHKGIAMKKLNLATNIVLVVFLTLTWANGQDHPVAAGRSSPEALPRPSATTSDTGRVRIGPGDLLELTVFDIPELAQTFRVSDGGDAVIALIGQVHLGGMTPAQAQAFIEQRLREGNFVREPHVSILIREYQTQGVSVLGQVAKPGVYPVLGSRTLLDVISEAGGITPLAEHDATIKRHSGGEVLKASLSDIPGELLASNVELQPGDTVIVPKAGLVYVLGDVGRPGGFVMENNGGMTLLQALAYAAGVNRTAAQSKTRLIHKTAEGYKETSIDLKRILQGKAADIALEREDIIYVPASTALTLAFRTPQVLQSVASSANVYSVLPK